MAKPIKYYQKNGVLYESWGGKIEGIIDEDGNTQNEILDKQDSSIYISINNSIKRIICSIKERFNGS